MERKNPAIRSYFWKFFPSLMLILCPFLLEAQIVIKAGAQYDRSFLHKFFWGTHYRKEWATPVRVQSLLLDTVAGGLKPYQEGGGRQTVSLRLRNPNDKEYVLRSVDKTFGKALPEIYRKTFIEKIINDQVSIGHPYAPVILPPMSDAAGIYHTDPRIFYVPSQPMLDSFNNEYGDRLYYLELRPDENWEEADNFGNSKKIVSTEKLLENIFEDSDHRVDQVFYIRARLFDMLIGDGSRREDQWRWASFKENGKTIYKAIPRDRDQAFAKFDGFLLSVLLSAADLSHLQTFRHHIDDVRTFNYPARYLDRQMANEPTLDQWIQQAKEIQVALTNETIEKAVMQLPPEIIPVSAKEMTSKLQSRRDHLQEYAKDYYLFLAEEVEIVGTEKNEAFSVQHLEDGQTLVTVSKINKEGVIKDKPFYSRSFRPGETKEIRLYGLEDNDIFHLDGAAANGITIRIIGGPGKDSIVDRSSGRKGTIRIYEDHDNEIISSSATKLFLSRDSSIHTYQYEGFKYNDRGIGPVLYYSHEDKLHVGLAYKRLRHAWRKDPFASKQRLQVNYSLNQKAFSFIYEGNFHEIMGKWNLLVNGNYDLMRWTNFFGLGNETLEVIKTKNYYQVESRDVFASVELNHPIGKRGSISFGPVYHMVRVLENKDRFIAQMNSHLPTEMFNESHFGGVRGTISFSHLNDEVLPTKGINFTTAAQYLKNIEETGKHVVHYNAEMHAYIPVFKNLILVLRPAAATVTGQPEFYQHVSIGGSQSLRGYKRDRFWGKTSFYSANELRYLFNVRSFLFNGKAGLVGFYDAGRVWNKNESSDLWHTGSGGGLLISPFNKFMLSVLYGLSTDGGRIHLAFSGKL